MPALEDLTLTQEAQIRAYLGIYPDHPGYAAGEWFLAQNGYVVLSVGVAMGTASTRFIPFVLHERIEISDLGARVTTADAAGLFGLALYASDPTTRRPTGNPVAAATGLSAATAGTVSAALAAPVVLGPGVYWCAVQTNSTTVVFQTASAATARSAMIGASALASLTSGTATGVSCISAPVTYASGLIDMTGQTFTPIANTGHALLYFKVSALP